jgi:hypothetical protein
MARKFLTHIDLTGNQLLNASFEKLGSDPLSGNFEGRIYYNTADDILKVYDGTNWIGVGAIRDVVGTPGEVDVVVSNEIATISLPSVISANITGSAGNAAVLQTGRTIALEGDVVGSVVFDGSASVSINTTIQPDSVALGTDTTGNYVSIISGTPNQINVSGSGVESASVSLSLPQDIHTGASPTFAGATLDNVQIGVSGANEIDTSTGNLVIDSAGGTVTVDDNLIINGDLTVNGTVTTVNTETINLADNIILFNSNLPASATPTENAGIEINRGNEPNVTLRWNETNNTWEATRDGTNYYTILLDGDTLTPADITGFDEQVEDVVGAMTSGSPSISVTYTDNGASAGTLSIDTILAASSSYLTASSGLAVDIVSLEAKLVTDSFTKKASANVGNNSGTSFAVTHNLGTRDVQVQVYDNATYDTVECDVVRTNTNTVTVSFSTAPTTDAYRVVIIG